MADPARAQKIADRIKVIVAETLEFRVKDERLGFVTITDVRVTGDLQNASVFYTVFGGEAERAETAAALESAKGKLRSAVGKGIGIRLTPTPGVLRRRAARDRRAHGGPAARGQGARRRRGRGRQPVPRYAGEADPYKKPVEDERRRRRRPRTGRPRDRRDRRAVEGTMTAGDRARRLRRAARRRQAGRLDQPRRRGRGPRGCAAPARSGHAGTLDPMATGVLVLGVDRATKLLTFLVGCDKTYTATIRLGQSTLTDDAEGEVTASYDVRRRVTTRRRRGGRRRAHRRRSSRCRAPSARSRSTASGPTPGCGRARTSSCRPGPVTVHRFAVLGVADADGAAATPCSTSTSRSRCPPAPTSGRWPATSARALGVGGHLTALRRTRVGRFDLDRRPLPGGAAGGQGRRRRTGAAAGGRGARVVRGPRADARRRRRPSATASGSRRSRRCAPSRWRPSPRTARWWPCWTSAARWPRPTSCSPPRVRRVSPVLRWTNLSQIPGGLRPERGDAGQLRRRPPRPPRRARRGGRAGPRDRRPRRRGDVRAAPGRRPAPRARPADHHRPRPPARRCWRRPASTPSSSWSSPASWPQLDPRAVRPHRVRRGARRPGRRGRQGHPVRRAQLRRRHHAARRWAASTASRCSPWTTSAERSRWSSSRVRAARRRR